VPKDTPDEVVATLEEAFAEANRQITEKQEPLGFVMEYITGDEVDEVMAMLREAYGPILEEAE
jgi:tripartite-type tricarboxylate transporter receptor subunit TctC